MKHSGASGDASGTKDGCTEKALARLKFRALVLMERIKLTDSPGSEFRIALNSANDIEISLPRSLDFHSILGVRVIVPRARARRVPQPALGTMTDWGPVPPRASDHLPQRRERSVQGSPQRVSPASFPA
jgi:hypothetical protein